MTKIIYWAIIGGVALILSGCSSTGKDPNSAELIYKEAKKLSDAGNYSGAVEQYEVLQSKYPHGIYTEQAWLEKAYLWYLQDLYQTSELELREFIRRYPNHKHLDYAYFMLGILQESPALTLINAYVHEPSEKDVSFLIAAKTHYQRFLRLFPDSKYAPVARERLPILDHELSMHELRVAKYYLETRAWVAAINRGKIIIENYPNTTAANEALLLMREGYTALGINSVADDISAEIKAKQIPVSESN